MTFRMRAAQQGLLAQALGAVDIAAHFSAQGFLAQSGATPGEVLLDDRRGKRSRLLIDEHGRLAQLTSPLGRSHRFSYDTQGRIADVLAPSGLNTSLSYGSDGYPSAVTRGAQQRWLFERDDHANLTKLILPDGVSYRAAHDGDRKVEACGFEAEPPIRIERNSQGLPTALVEPSGARTAFEYGAWSRPDRTVRADGSVEAIERNAAGQLVSASCNGEAWFNTEYDPAGRVSALRYADGHFVEFRYNDSGQVVEAKNPTSVVSLSYDGDGRLLSEVQNGQSVRYDYDPGGLLVGITPPGGEVVRFAYDDDARLSSVVDWQGAVHRVFYDPGGQLVTHQFPNGRVTSRHLLPTGLPFDVRTEHTHRTDRDLQQRFAFTANDQLSATEDAEVGLRSYGYDQSGRLTLVRSPSGQYDEEFSYDASGNRKYANGVPFASNSVNQIVRCGPLSYEYDGRGNLIAESSQAGTTRYHYNGQNLLVKVCPAAGPCAEYSYDAFGRRISKKVGDTEAHYVWARDQLLGELSVGPVSERRDYLFLPGTHTPLSMRVAGITYQFHNDLDGTPRWLTDPSGRVAWSGVRTGFGHVHLLVSTVRQPFRFPGQYFDDETGLHYNRARYYSPLLGRYISRDPVDLLGGVNLYVYCNNNPLNDSDPLGLFSWGAAALATAGIVVGAVAIAVCLPAIALTVAGAAAVVAVVAGAALVAGCVAVIASDIKTDGCFPCMAQAFKDAAWMGAKVGFEMAMIVLTGGAAGPALALADGGLIAATGSGLGSAAVAIAAAVGVLMSGSSDGGGGSRTEKDDAAAKREADAKNKADAKSRRELEKKSSQGDKDATVELNKQRAADPKQSPGGKEGYLAENKVIESEGDNVVEAGRKVKYPDPKNPGSTISSDIDVETKTQVTQVKSGADMPSDTQAECTRLRAAETGKQPNVVYDPSKMDPQTVADFKAANPDFTTTPMNLR